MDSLTPLPTVAHVIQQALTPVFLLTGVGAILNVLTGRLVRAVDRFRYLSEITENASKAQGKELLTLPVRVHLIRWAISLCTLCALFICMSIVALFLGAELGVNSSSVVSVLFITAILALTVALCIFLREITMAAGIIEIKKV